MINIKKSLSALADLKTFSRRFNFDIPASTYSQSPQRMVPDFGANPGNLRMFAYLPKRSIGRKPLVVVLHGCGQTAPGYDHGAGWSTLADRYGFALLVPEQQRTNNPNGCYNWFQPSDTQRGMGEAASIHQMIQTMVRDDGIDPLRVFVTGLSAGGAMTSVMLACYPDVFEAGAIVAGLPYGAASNVQQALGAMYQCPTRSSEAWRDEVLGAAPGYRGKWPRVSVWHGGADKTVVPTNAEEIVKQWTAVHGLASKPSLIDTVDGHPRRLWLDASGNEVVESYAIADMAHGTPLSTGDADFQCGSAGPFLIEAGISSSFHIARFFGLTHAVVEPIIATGPERGLTPSNVSDAPVHSQSMNDPPAPEDSRDSRPRAFDVGAVIAKALSAAGLMK